MSRCVNSVTLIGNVGHDPSVKTTPAGVKVAKLSLATTRTWNDRSGQRQEKTEWHRLTFWDRLADVVEQYVQKGDRLYVEGRIEYSQTEDDAGNKRGFVEIVVRELVMLGGSGDSERTPALAATASTAAPSPFDADDEDLPF